MSPARCVLHRRRCDARASQARAGRGLAGLRIVRASCSATGSRGRARAAAARSCSISAPIVGTDQRRGRVSRRRRRAEAAVALRAESASRGIAFRTSRPVLDDVEAHLHHRLLLTAQASSRRTRLSRRHARELRRRTISSPDSEHADAASTDWKAARTAAACSAHSIEIARLLVPLVPLRRALSLDAAVDPPEAFAHTRRKPSDARSIGTPRASSAGFGAADTDARVRARARLLRQITD